MAKAWRMGDCVRLPDGRIGRVRAKSAGQYRVRVRRTTSATHQFLTLTAKDLKQAVSRAVNGLASRPPANRLASSADATRKLVNAGVLLSGEGLQPSSKGVRVRFSRDRRTVIDGPFTEIKELLAGYWLWQVKSKEKAIEWVKRCPNRCSAPRPRSRSARYSRTRTLGEKFTPELREQEERLRAQLPQKR
jgi:hypothetical protein